MKKELISLHSRLQKLQMDIHQELAAIAQSIPSETVPDLVDAGYLCRELSSMCDDLRKGLTNRQVVIARYLAARAAVDGMQGSETSLKGELATATPDIKVMPKIPENGSTDYIELMRWIGVPDELISRDMLRPSFSTIQRVLTQMAVDGKKPPPGISMTYTDAQVVFRKRKGKTDGKQEDF